jgi:TolA-binding protein
MLTPTFGEILIAQKKFNDAQRVFTELSKKDPDNDHFKRKIEFLNKLVKLKN